ncbi:MAG: hypothetical protein HQL74_02305 [Magnetococcales bacterium]|nr:hypothetical protein [Magnetococcales bacterium]
MKDWQDIVSSDSLSVARACGRTACLFKEERVMERIAASIAERFNHDGHVFQTVAGEYLDSVCGGQAIRVDEGFGKKRFIFQDGSSITIGDGRWYLGFEHCFCGLGDGHFPGCHNQETVPISSPVLSEVPKPDAVVATVIEETPSIPSADVVEETPSIPSADVVEETPPIPSADVVEEEALIPPAECVPNPPAFTIRTYGKINSTIAMEGSRNQARRQARGLLSLAAGVTHSCLMDARGRIIDAYELVPLAHGEGKIKKIKPGDLSQLNQIELPF